MGPLGFFEVVILGVMVLFGLAVVGSVVYVAVRLANRHETKISK